SWLELAGQSPAISGSRSSAKNTDMRALTCSASPSALRAVVWLERSAVVIVCPPRFSQSLCGLLGRLDVGQWLALCCGSERAGRQVFSQSSLTALAPGNACQ